MGAISLDEQQSTTRMDAPRILVIEDSLMLIRPLCRLVNKQGFIAVPVTSLAEVRQALAVDPRFMAAVADYCLPDAPSGEVLPLLLENRIPTVVLTAHNDMATRERVLSMPVVDYIPKESPSAFEYVMKMLRRIRLNPSIKVLVVDDSLAMRQLLRTQLERHLYQVLEAADAEQALTILRQERGIKLVLTDHDMPGMDGVRMTSTVRRFLDPTHLAIIGISGSQDPTMTARFIKAGADDYLQKPFNYEEFFCRVTRNVEFVENLQALKESASKDPLSGLSNRRHFFEQASALRHNIGVAVLDIDLFKRINDGYGHDVGDRVIYQTARLLESFFPDDIVARFGGEEFVILSQEVNASVMLAQLDKLRRALANLEISTPLGDLRFTVSIGMAATDESDIGNLLKQADNYLYQAKHRGRNQVCGGMVTAQGNDSPLALA
ncbi:response regulator protein [Aquitalea magnusonii]|jgi:diguanylate cyclase (GGDEF)-like protein|uniref:diguanylate cyclase n=1 Tax=Aquitalea magnusonii TaxID=332411 RepID=A0A3G9GIN0_9NEIS|nr:diguanylate cyclase [Aquitalea magnusonii]BBF86131.1 response regulator protein [Aquitalea magnusonii]